MNAPVAFLGHSNILVATQVNHADWEGTFTVQFLSDNCDPLHTLELEGEICGYRLRYELDLDCEDKIDAGFYSVNYYIEEELIHSGYITIKIIQ